MGFLSSVFLIYFLVFLSKSSAELITALPDQPGNVSFNQYSGYVVTDVQHGRALFYYFVEADSVDPLTRPLTVWLNGGPGCSSLGFGAFVEHGPFQPGEDGRLYKNHKSNLLYVESPVGVGFSYSNTSSDYIKWNDTQTAEDNLKFIIHWLAEFPQYKDRDLYLTGESYAGHYIPQLASLIIDYNKMPYVTPIKLKAIAIGNPLLDLDISVNAANYLWTHGAISDETLEMERTMCNDTTNVREKIYGTTSEACSEVFYRVEHEVGDFTDFHDLLGPPCLSADSSEQFPFKGKHANIFVKLAQKSNNGDPCLPGRVFTYLNRPEVQKAFHANTTNLPNNWGFCSSFGPLQYQMKNLDTDMIPVVADVIKSGIPIMLYSGDQDSKIPLTQTRIIANMLAKDLKLAPITDYVTWYSKKQVGGWGQTFKGLQNGKNVTLTYATVRGAAHEVPYTSPSQALTLFKAFLSGSQLPGY